ncbi:MAG: alpha-amylase family glycosyl hydrolase [candidate division Zixibacteria bacterium]
MTDWLIEILRAYFPFGLQISKKSWNVFNLKSYLTDYHTSRRASDIKYLRELAHLINQENIRQLKSGIFIHAGQINTAGLITDILRYLLIRYCNEDYPGVKERVLGEVKSAEAQNAMRKIPPAFIDHYPPPEVIYEMSTREEYLRDNTETIKNQELIFTESILLYLMVANPAFNILKSLFDDEEFESKTKYSLLIKEQETIFSRQPVFEPLGMPLFECLKAPMKACPDSLDDQLEYIKANWSSFLPTALLKAITRAMDISSEEKKIRGFGPGPNIPLAFDSRAQWYDDTYPEHAAYSRDADWMSNVVLMAKSVYVWLDQLSKKYQRHIKYLSDIPDEELDLLARWGFTGLWLIGLWERSPASRKIKQIMGNPEAAPSAYSIYDYTIAHDLGGETAYLNIRDRAWQRGIRFASDMVPNHMGIYSNWVIEHPDWFLNLSESPYPWYSYTGVDLSENDRIVIQIEDGYWEKRDAAVVFKRIEKWTGETKYIYHGNDGTSTPWNDTAQLNFLIPEVREAVIQNILAVARKFSIIRFDAAMTLAKKHYQRLWFPKAGEGGDIPTRSQFGMSRGDLDKCFPIEFWREVVDRVAAEVPDTLLLAEAFWLMEGYFVRTLGMHRVYNSAFMNMLKDEDNAKYRMTIKNILEFSPQILKRFVNFMSNPDEETAVEQFGKEDKYFGVAVMMVTMPGLPMFGHGQIEGFTEKYGMEYYRAYWDESPDETLIHRHEHEIFPLMRRRNLFSGSENFALFDFVRQDGNVNENVFAFCNRFENERAIIIYNNSYGSTEGRIHTSTAINIKEGEDKQFVHKSIGEALSLNTGENVFYKFHDYHVGLEYLRSARQIANDGLYVFLNGYHYHAFLDFVEIYDVNNLWGQLNERLGGRGVRNLEEELKYMQLEPVLNPLRMIITRNTIDALKSADKETISKIKNDMDVLYKAVIGYLNTDTEYEDTTSETLMNIEKMNELCSDKQLVNSLTGREHILLGAIIIDSLSRFSRDDAKEEKTKFINALFDDWMLRPTLQSCFESIIGDNSKAYIDALLAEILVKYPELVSNLYEIEKIEIAGDFFGDDLIKIYLQVNEYESVRYFKKENFEKLIDILLCLTVIKSPKKSPSKNKISALCRAAENTKKRAKKSAYRLDDLI